ncbi:LPS-assembly protein LptD [Reinekea blandensis]|uniref:LPS-assembly protein LptD n=1 Tax=Reinekea blandensis MED297 TaxID=314283 RepID=A4BAJ3_9GAMM|nr:LPS assembly protein LptD [Reinekea blandensis]EAR10949.1 Organic solvent tolerance protein [Reinekea sp. MED297] [Reinekea blandensis MED297]
MSSKLPVRHYLAITVIGFSLLSQALAESVVVSDWQPWSALPESEKQGVAPYCPGGFIAMPLQAETNPEQHFRFDQGQFNQDRSATLNGHVVIQGPNLASEANAVNYQPDGISTLSGEVNFRLPGVAFSSDEAEISIEGYYAQLKRAEFVLAEQDLHGQADSIERQSERRFRANDIAFTRCAPSSNAWRIRAARLDIDNEEQIARAWHSRVEVQNIPVLYLPYVSFPLNDQARTGFLIPTFGSGYYQEYYLHLAPNYDATLAANYVGQQGLYGHTEFRFLTEHHNGITNLGVSLTEPDSQDLDRDTRDYAFEHRQSGELTDWLGYDLQTRWVSHKDYDVEITPGANKEIEYNRTAVNLTAKTGQATSKAGVTYLTPVSDSSKLFDELQSRFSVKQSVYSLSILQENHWAHEGLTVAPASYELIRQPQITLGWAPGAILGNLQLNQTGQYSRFRRDLSDEQINALAGSERTLATETQRTDTNTRLTYPLQAGPVKLTPTVEGLYAFYRRDNETDLNVADTYGENSLHQASWRSSLDLSATLPWQSQSVEHRVKPRIYWAYSPFIEQNGPILDAEAEDNFTLFSRSRFTSVDRVGDLNRLSTQLAYEVSPIGQSYPAFSTSLRKGLKLSQERLTLTGVDAIDSNWQTEYSPWVMGAEVKPSDRLTLSASGDLDHEQTTFNRFDLNLDFRPSERVFANAHWEKTDDYHALSAGAYFPIRQNVALIGYGELATRDDQPEWRDYQPTQLLAGIDIDSCCWNIRFALLETSAAEDEDGAPVFLEQSTIAPYFEVTLKGIGAGAGTIENILERLDFGYAGRLFNSR